MAISDSVVKALILAGFATIQVGLPMLFFIRIHRKKVDDLEKMLYAVDQRDRLAAPNVNSLPEIPPAEDQGASFQ